jgi:phosphatidylglycerophosphatase A
MSADSGTAVPNAVPSISDASRPPVTAQRKPRLALFIATACGLGYIPIAPGTWGSLAGIFVYVLIQVVFPPVFIPGLRKSFEVQAWSPAWVAILIGAVIALLGVWAADRVAKFSQIKDPQFVVIDEVSGQYLALLLGIALPAFAAVHSALSSLGSGGTYFVVFHLGLKYVLLGFILFRVFDIWKPFPARQAESLPGGWGIMADDWIAGVYAAIGLWIARAAGL